MIAIANDKVSIESFLFQCRHLIRFTLYQTTVKPQTLLKYQEVEKQNEETKKKHSIMRGMWHWQSNVHKYSGSYKDQ